MKKEIIISVIILVAVIVLNIITEIYTDQHMSEVASELSKMRESVKQGNEDEINSHLQKVNETWDKLRETFVIYIEHTELEKVEKYLTEAASYAETKEYNMCMQTIDTCIFIIDHIKDKYEFGIKNIF